MAILANDTCVRSDQSGLGTSSDGQTYTINGTMTTSIASNEAVITATSGFPSAFLGTKTTASINFLVRLEQTNSNFDGVGPCFRAVDGNNMYFVAAYAGSGGLLFAKLVSGGFTSLATGSFTLNTGVFYWIRVIMSGSHLQARIWQDGNSEPATWLIDTTDTTYSSAGRFGISTNGFSTDTVKFDHITVTDNQSVTTVTKTLPTRFLLRIQKVMTIGARVLLRTMRTVNIPARFLLRTSAARALLTRARISTKKSLSLPFLTMLRGSTLVLPMRFVLQNNAVIPPTNAVMFVRSGVAQGTVRSGSAIMEVRG